MTTFQQFSWVPDGVYDSSYYLVRYDILGGNARRVITKMWLDEGGPSNLTGDIIKPWGSFPDLPAKPGKN